MRKLLFAALFMASAFGVFAQKLDDVKEKIQKGKFDEAKEKIDKVMADPKTATAEAWFYKAVVYNGLAKANPADMTLRTTALDAIQHYFQAESGIKEQSKRFLLSTLENHKTAFDIYSAAFQAGVKSYQDKNYEQSFTNFKTALETFDLLSANNLVTVKFDTTSTLYAGISAQNAKKLDDAAHYYAMIADRRIADPNYLDLYEFLAQYYMEKKDEANMNKYLKLGEELYPTNKNWVAFELASVGNDKEKKKAKYQELLQKDPKNYAVALDYVIELFGETYGGEPKKEGDPAYTAQKETLTKAIDNLISINPTAAAYYIQTQHLGNQVYDLQVAANAIKGTKPEDVQKKKNYNSQVSTLFEQLFASSTKAYDLYTAQSTLKADEKQNLRKVINNLVDYYQYKKNAAKVAELQAKLKTM